MINRIALIFLSYLGILIYSMPGRAADISELDLLSEDPYRCCEGELCGEGTEEDPYYTVTYAEYHDGSNTGPQFWGPWETREEHNSLMHRECRDLPECDGDGESRCLDDEKAEPVTGWVALD